MNWTFDDGNGNISTQTQTVIVEDTTAPVPDVAELATVTGECSATVSAPTATDNCSGAIIGSTSDPLTYDEQGTYTVNWTFDDGNGNSSTQIQTVVVDDTTAPVVVTQNITVQLDASGNTSITAAQVDNGSSDACGITSFSVAPDSFTCADVGANTVILTVTDVNGNVNTATATVTVEDTVAPVVVTQDITVQLDAGGNASIVAGDVDNGSSDACGIAGLSVAPNSFTCANVGANTVILTVTDVNGNVNTATATVTVVDNEFPVIQSNAPATIIPPDAPISFTATATDNCDVSVVITRYDCFKFTKKGKRIDKTGSCVVAMDGATITILDSGGVDDNITWHIVATDANGNVTEADYATLVINPGNGNNYSGDNGNNGVGNGVDGQPSGDPPINDDEGTSPGNPGNKGGKKK